MINWQEVVLQICFDDALIASENSVKPAARSTASTMEVLQGQPWMTA